MKHTKRILLALLFLFLMLSLFACKGSAVTVKFYVDGELYQTERVENGGYLEEIPEVPKKDGYKGAWSVTNFDEITESMDVYAVYTSNTYTISFYVDGEFYTSRTANSNQNITDIPVVPGKDGYNGRWSTSVFSTVRTDTRVDAVYTQRDYIATFYRNNPSFSKASVLVGSAIEEGTYYEKNGEEYSLTKDKEFAKGKVYYEITRTVYSTSLITGGTVRSVPDSPDSSKYSTKWVQIKKTAEGEFLVDPVYEGWTENVYYVEYPYVSVTFIGKNGETIGTFDCEIGDTLSALNTPAALNNEYEFYGYYYDAELQHEVSYPITLTQNIRLYAKWMNVARTEGLTIVNGVVTGYTGTATEVFVPYKYKQGTAEQNVTRIGESAFASNNTILTIHLPGTLTSIAEHAFENCKSLMNVRFDDGCYLETIGDNAFYECQNLLTFAFSNQTSLIGKRAFYGCSSLRSISGEGNACFTRIQEQAFLGCESLSSFDVPSSVKTIGDSAFEGCVVCRISFNTPENVLSIGARAFADCARFEGILAVSAVHVGENAFAGCPNLTNVTASSSGTVHKMFGAASASEDYYNVTVGDATYAVPKYLSGVAIIKEEESEGVVLSYAMKDMYSVKSLILCSGITEVQTDACILDEYNSTASPFNLTLNDGENGLKKIASNAFSGRTDLRSLALPSSLIEIGDEAFKGLEQLVHVTIPANNDLSIVGRDVFADTEWFTGTSGIIKLGTFVLGVSETYCRNRDYKVIQAEDMGNCRKIAPYAFYGNRYLKEITVGNLVAEVGEYAFAQCVNLEKFAFNSRINEISERVLGDFLLEGDIHLADLTVFEDIASNKLFTSTPSTLQTLRIHYAKKGHQIEKENYTAYDGVEKLFIGDGFEIVAEEAFSDYNALREVTFGKDVEEIQAKAFYNVTTLNKADFSANEELRSIGVSAFENTALTEFEAPMTLKVISANAFKGADLTEFIGPNGLLEIGEGAFRSNFLTSVALPESVNKIESYAFANCRLASFALPANAVNEDLGEGILIGNNYLNMLTLANGLVVETLFTEGETIILPNNFNTVRITGGEIANNELYGLRSVQTVNIASGVTVIGESAFEGCTGIRSITIPASVEKIGSRAFADCTALSSCQIDSDSSSLQEIGNKVFLGDSALIYVVFPKNVALVDWTGMFDGCVRLATTSLPETVRVIGENAYRGCAMLVTIGMHDEVTEIGESAFEGCEKIDFDDVKFNSLTTIGKNAFKNCYALHGIKAENATSIGENAFDNCTSIEEITISSQHPVSYYISDVSDLHTINVICGEEIVQNAFNGCNELSTIIYYCAIDTPEEISQNILTTVNALQEDVLVFAETNLYSVPEIASSGRIYLAPMSETMFTFELDGVGKTATITGFAPSANAMQFDGVLYLPSEYTEGKDTYRITAIGEGAFEGITTIKSVVIPANIVEIQSNAFNECAALSTLRFESGSDLRSIGNAAFAECTALQAVAFPSSVLTIGNNAFKNDINLCSVTFYANSKLTTIGSYAFENAEKISDFAITGPVREIGQSAFFACQNMTSFDFGTKTVLTEIKSSLFMNCYKLQEIRIPSTVTTISASAFRSCALLTEIALPNAVRSIGQNAFSNTGLQTVTFGSSLMTIGQSAFENCNALTDVVLPDSVTQVEQNAFSGCISITDLTIGKGVKTIGNSAFYSARSLTTISFLATEMDDLSENNNIFVYAGQDSAITLYIGANVTRIPAYLFDPSESVSNAPNFVAVAIAGTSLEEIGEKAFAYCATLTSFTVPVSVLTLGANAFYKCSRLSIKLEATSAPVCFDADWDNELSILPQFGYNNLTTEDYTYVVKDGYAYLTHYAGTQTEVAVPETVNGYPVKDVGAAFENNTSVVYVDMPKSVTGIGSFYGCTSLKHIEIGEATKIRKNCFYNCSSLELFIVPETLTEIGQNAFYGCVDLGIVVVLSPVIASQLYVTERVDGEYVDITDNVIGGLTRYAENLYIDDLIEAKVNAKIYHRVTGLGIVEYFGYKTYTKLYYNVSKNASQEEWCSEKTTERLTTGKIDVEYCDCNGFQTLLSSEGKANELVKHSPSQMLDYLISSFDDLGSAFAQLRKYFTLFDELETISPAVGTETFKAYEELFILAQELFGDSNVSIKEDINYTLSAGAMIGINTPFVLSFGANADLTYDDIMIVVARMFGFDDVELFARYAQLLANAYIENAYAASTNNMAARLRYDGTVYTRSSSFIMPFVFARESFDTLSAFIIVDSDGTMFLWINDLSGAFNTFNSGNISYTEGIPKVTAYGRCVLFDLPEDTVNVYLLKAAFYDEDEYVLVVEGKGEMTDFLSQSLIPWNRYLDKITNITIGENVTTLGMNAFSNMLKLKTVNYYSITATYLSDKRLFTGSGTQSNGITLYIGENVTTLPAYFFNNNSSLIDIKYDETTLDGEPITVLTSIGSHAFSGCTALSEVNLPESVQTIGDNAFNGCSSVLSVTIGSNVTSIGSRAFYKTDSLETLNYNAATVADFTENLFIFTSERDMTAIGGGFDLYIGENVTNVPAYLFYGLKNIKSVNFSDHSGLTSIGKEAFAVCESIMSVTLPASLVTIGQRAFANDSKLASISFKNGSVLQFIGAEAFADTAYYRNDANWTYTTDSSQGVLYINNIFLIKAKTTLFGDYRIVDPTKVIANNAFDGCVSLEYIRIPVTVQYIGEDAFNRCTNLHTVYIMSKPIISQLETENSFGELVKNATHIYVLSSLYSEQNAKTGIYVANNFSEIVSLVSFTSGDYKLFTTASWSVGENGSKAIQAYLVNDEANSGYYVLNIGGAGKMQGFSEETPIPWSEYYSSIRKVNINEGVTGIGNKAFRNFTSLIEISIAGTVTEIGEQAFEGCRGLTSIELPESLTMIGERAFYECTSVTKVVFNATRMNDLTEENGVFGKLGSATEVKTAVEIARTVEYVPAYLFCPSSNASDMPAVKSVKFLSYNSINNVSKIGDYAFAFLKDMNSLTFASGETLTEIGSGAFEGCSSLMGLDITVGIVKIGRAAFKDCSGITEIAFMATEFEENEAGMFAFKGTGSVAGYQLSISARSAYIPSHLFEGSEYLTSVVFQTNGSCVKIGEYAFEDCTGLTAFVVPDHVKEVGEGMLSGCTSLKTYTAPFAGGKSNIISAAKETTIGYVFGTTNKTGTTATQQQYFSALVYVAYIPDSLEEVEITLYTNVFRGTFENCKHIKQIRYNTHSTIDIVEFRAVNDNGQEFVADTINNGFYIQENAFKGCSSLTNVQLAPQVRTIGQSSFEGCEKLDEFTGGVYVENIGVNAFYGCKSMTKLYFNATNCADFCSPDGNETPFNVFAELGMDKTGTEVVFGTNVKKVPAYMFAVSNARITPAKLTSVRFATGTSECESIGVKAFYNAGATSLQTISLPSSLKSIGAKAFEGTNYYTDEERNWDARTYLVISKCLIKVKPTISSATFNIDGVYLVADRALEDCRNIVTVYIADSVKYIGDYAFCECSGLRNVQISEQSQMISIGAYAFKNCSELGSWKDSNDNEVGFSVRTKVESIGDYAFYGCTKLTTVYIDSETISKSLDKNDGTVSGGILAYAKTIFVHSSIKNTGTYILNRYSGGAINAAGYKVFYLIES